MNITPAIKPEREEANVLPILNLKSRCSSEIKSLERFCNLFMFFYYLYYNNFICCLLFIISQFILKISFSKRSFLKQLYHNLFWK